MLNGAFLWKPLQILASTPGDYSTYPSTIWDKSSASYAHALANNSVCDYSNSPEILYT